jgi:hypothetical protein
MSNKKPDLLYIFQDKHVKKNGRKKISSLYRSVSLTSVVCKQMEHVTAGYLREVWEMSGWLYEVSTVLDQGTHAKVN